MSAEADSTLEILIKTVLDTTGYRMNEAEAVKLKAAIGQTAAVSVAANIEDAAGTEALILKKRELFHIINALGGQAVPELSRALSTLYVGGGTAAGVFALVGVFEAVRNAISRAADKAREAAQGAWAAQHDALVSAAQAAEDFAEDLDAARSNTDKLKIAQDLETAVLDAQIDAHKKLLDAIEKQQLAAANGNKEQQDAIKRRFEDLKGEYDIIAEMLRLKTLSADIDKRNADSGPRSEAASAAEKKLEDEKKSSAAAEAVATIERLGGADALPKLKIAHDKAQKDLDEKGADLESSSKNANLPEGARIAAGYILAGLKQAVSDYNSLDQALTTDREHGNNVRRLTQTVVRARKARDENNKAIEDETTQLVQGQAVLKVHQETQNRQEAFNRVEGAGGINKADDIIGAGVAATEAYMHGQRLNQQQVDQLANMRALFETVGGNSVAIVNILKQSLAHHATQAQEIAQLKQDFANLKSISTRPNQ